jgi:hypothetical protein
VQLAEKESVKNRTLENHEGCGTQFYFRASILFATRRRRQLSHLEW